MENFNCHGAFYKFICFSTCLIINAACPYSMASEPHCDTVKVGGGKWLDIDELDNLRGSAAGSSVLLLHKLPQLTNIKVKFSEGAPFARQLKQLQQGELDIIAGVYPTSERKQQFIFSNNYYYEKLFVFAKPENIDKYSDIASLEGSIGAVIRKASYGEPLDQFFSDASNVIQVNNQEERLKLLLKGRADYFIGTITAVGFSPEMKNVAISKNPIYRQGTALAFSKNSECKMWIPQINTIIEQLFSHSQNDN